MLKGEYFMDILMFASASTNRTHKKKFIIFAIVLFIFLALFLQGRTSSNIHLQKIKINNHSLSVEVADTDSLRTKGLSGRISMPPDQGMLFVFPISSYYRFWMADMKFPLDFIWINKNTVVDLTENVPVPSAGSELPTFTSKNPFDRVIEVNAGVIRSLGIKQGDKVQF